MRWTVRLGLIASMVILAGVLLLAVASGTAVAQEATNVTVEVQPGETVAGETIGGPPTVLVTDEFGAPVEFVEVQVTVVEGPGAIVSGEPIVMTNANGEASFDDLVIDQTGTYRLEFVANYQAELNATSVAFDVVADPNSIQAMVDAAEPGDTIEVEPGTYVENVTVDTANLTITAAGEERPHVEGGFLIEADGMTIADLNVSGGYHDGAGIGSETANVSFTVQGAHISDTGAYGIAGDGIEALTVTETTIQGTGDHGIVTWNVVNVTVSSTTIQGTDGVGVGAEIVTGTVEVTETDIQNTVQAGVLVLGGEAVTVSQVEVDETTGLGVGVEGTDGDVSVSATTVREAGNHGVVVQDTGDVEITAVDVRSVDGHGVATELTGAVTITETTVREAGSSSLGIGIWDAGDVAVTNVDVNRTFASGVGIDGADTVAVTNATVLDPTGSGIVVNDSDSVTIDESTATRAGEDGIRVAGVTTVTVSDAVARSIGETGIFVNGADEATISHVDVDTVGANGVLVAKSGNVTVEGSAIRNADLDGLGSYSTTNVTAVDTTIRGVDNDGVSVRMVDTVTVSGVEIRNAIRYGIFAYRSGGITVIDSVVVDGGTGVRLADVSWATLTTNHIANNTVGLRSNDPLQRLIVDATDNWWGASDGPGGEGSGHGDPVYGAGSNVEFEPFLTITSSDAFEVGPGFTGVVHDDGGVPVTASGFATDEFDVESGVALVEIAGQTVPLKIVDGEINATINATEYLEPTTETGVVTADLEGLRQDDLRLVHEAYDLEAGYTRWSIPQPAALYTTGGVTDVTQWRNDAAAYDDAGFSTDDGSLVTGGADLHRGMFVYAESDGERLGYDFATPGEASLPPGGAEPIGEGWNLLGSNYDVSSNDNLTLNHDLATVTNLPATAGDYTGEDDVVAFDPRSYNRLGGTYAVGPYETYWVYVDVGHPTEFRAITAPEYDPGDDE